MRSKMLQPLMSVLAQKEIILASSSPRRKQILQDTGLKFRVVASKFEENLDKSLFPEVSGYVLETARQKTLEVKNRIIQNGEQADLIIGADTVVTIDGVINEKPRDKQHAVDMIKSYCGRRHTVYSGVCILARSGAEYRETSFTEGTDVEFAELADDVIIAYVDTGEPMDKAGGYGIQGLGGSLISAIHGDYYNVMGFPLHKFCLNLTNILRTM